MGRCLIENAVFDFINNPEQWQLSKSTLTGKGWEVFHDYWYNSLAVEKSAYPEAFVYSDQEKIFFIPYFLKCSTVDKKKFLFESPDGFAPPISNTEDQSFFCEAFRSFADNLRKKNVVAGLIRQHPFLEELPSCIEAKELSRREYVFLKLKGDYEEVYSGYHKSLRRRLKKAYEAGVKVKISSGRNASDAFADIYVNRMNEVNARAGVRYSKDYLNLLINMQGSSSRLYLCYDTNDNVIAGCVVLFGLQNAFYHLSASIYGFRELSPNDVIRDFVIRDLLKSQYERLGFGGGRTDDNQDTLLTYKKKFTNEVSYSVALGIVLDRRCFNEVNVKWDAKHTNHNFRDHFLRAGYK